MPNQLRNVAEQLLSEVHENVYAVSKHTKHPTRTPITIRRIEPHAQPFDLFLSLIPPEIKTIFRDWVPEGAKLSKILISKLKTPGASLEYSFHFEIMENEIIHRWSVHCDGRVVYYIPGYRDDDAQHETHPAIPKLQKLRNTIQEIEPSQFNPDR
jgi:hypothetical protein